MRFSRWRWAAPALAVGFTTSCATLPDVQPGVCGNGVVEPENGEDCDQKDSTTCGKPNTASQCRYRCDLDNGIECPKTADWRCGHDKVCRLPSSPAAWSTWLDVPGPGASELLAADFDGDGISDALSVAAPLVDVTYFEAGRAATPGDEILAQSPHPTVGSLTAEAPPTIFATVSRGLGAFTGSADRTLLAATYATLSTDIVGVRLQTFLLYDTPTSIVSTKGTAFFGYNDAGVASFQNAVTLDDLVPFGPNQNRVGDGVVARFDTQRGCQQMALSFNEKTTKRGHVVLYAPCDTSELVKVHPIADVSLPPPMPGGDPPALCVDCQPVQVLDVDGDERPDLVIVDQDYKAHVAYGDGHGHFGQAPGVVTDVASGGFASPAPEPPLAIADLNGDCALDFASSSGVWVSVDPAQPSCAAGAVPATGFVSTRSAEEPHQWTEARVADLNKDGRPDVVMASSTKPGITAYFGTGAPLLNPFQIVTDSPTKALAVGDLDGDLVDDVAFAEIGEVDPDDGTAIDSVYVSFGSPGGTPTFARSVGEVDIVDQILPSYEAAIYPDLIADLFVVTQDKPVDPSSAGLYVFPGNSDRQINAPFFLLDVSGKSLDVPRRALVGAFSDGSDHRDVAMFARSPEGIARLWLAATGDEASIAPIGTPGAPQSTELPSAAQGVDDVLLIDLGPRAGVSYDDLAIAFPPLSSDKSGATYTWLTTTRGPDGVFQAPTDPVKLAGFDIAGDGAIAGQMITARVLQGDRNDLVLVSPRSGLAVVPWDASTGALDPDHAARLGWGDVASLGCGNATLKKPRPTAGVAALAAKEGSAQTLVLVRPGASYLVSFDGASLVAACAGVDGGDAVTTGDFDGDGIEDILVSQQTGLTVFYGDARAAGWTAEDAQ